MENKLYCKFKDCQDTWDEDKPDCKCGEINYKDKDKGCKNYIGDKSDSIIENATEKEKVEGQRLPWHSSSMGELDISWLKSQRQPIIIGVVGQAEAGKTTLIATLYMLLRNGSKIGNYEFAGSYTLLGWEKIAHFLGFYQHKKLNFPPHTSSKTARIPGLLHLCLKDNYGQYHDILFTDAPGEWFTNWAARTEGEESRGARWIDEYADAFIVIADTEAFIASIGSTRRNLMSVVQKMRNTYQNRPSVLVWTKADKVIDSEIKKGITQQVIQNLPNIQPFDVAVININDDSEHLRENILNLVNHLLVQKHNSVNSLPQIEVKNPNDFFFSIRLDSYERK